MNALAPEVPSATRGLDATQTWRQSHNDAERRGGEGTKEAREGAPGVAGSEGDEEVQVGRARQVLFA